MTSSSVSTGAARIVSYVRWNEYLTKVPNMVGNALGEEDGGRDDPGADEVDVVVPGDLADERAEAEADCEQIDGRLDRRREGRGAPVRRVVDDLADEDAGQGRPLEPAETMVRRGAAAAVAVISRSPCRSGGRTHPRDSRAVARPLERARPHRRSRGRRRSSLSSGCGPSARRTPRPRRASSEPRRPQLR